MNNGQQNTTQNQKQNLATRTQLKHTMVNKILHRNKNKIEPHEPNKILHRTKNKIEQHEPN
jgi:hypothetical protein